MKQSPMPLVDRLELAAQACRAAHLLSCEETCREAAALLRTLTPSANGKHWVYAAAEAHDKLLAGVEPGEHPWQRQHLDWMLGEIRFSGMSPTKACRWLGWVQACLCFAGCATLDELKSINLRAATESRKA